MSVVALRDWTALVPPPVCVKQRSWERAWCLIQGFPERLAPAERRYCEQVLRACPCGLGWPEIGELMRLWTRLVLVRC